MFIKRKVAMLTSLAFGAMALFLVTASTGNASADPATPMVMENPGCPIGTVTIQGCISLDDGCYTVATINGRTIHVNLSSVSVGDGDVASLTGTFIGDQDCDPCVLNVTSATDLGDC